jgi:hypothetical protein
MLITTYVGLVVNSDHVAYITLKRCEIVANDETHPNPLSPATLHKVLLCLAGGDHVVAATELGLTTAQRLRQEMAQRWTEGAKAFNVTDALQRLCDTQKPV